MTEPTATAIEDCFHRLETRMEGLLTGIEGRMVEAVLEGVARRITRFEDDTRERQERFELRVLGMLDDFAVDLKKLQKKAG